MIRIQQEGAGDIGPREALLDRAFGPGRHLKTSARMRVGRLPAKGLALVACNDVTGQLLGSIRLWDVALGQHAEGDGRRALMLGPIGVDPAAQGQGVGGKLMRFALAEAAFRGHSSVILVGDPEWYEQFGFSGRYVADLRLPGPVEQRRFLGLELRPRALDGACGVVRPIGAAILAAQDTAVAIAV
jgi:predicted N-acetyltransferase YhbS